MACMRIVLVCVMCTLLGACGLVGGGEPEQPAREASMADMADSMKAADAAAKDNESLEWRLQQIESNFLDFQEEHRSQRAELMKRLDEQDAQLSAMSKSLEDSRALNEELKSSIAVLGSAAQMRANAVTADSMASAPATPAAPKVVRRVAPKKVAKAAPAPRPAARPAAGTGKSSYDTAYDLYSSGKNDEARAAFNDFLAANPKSSLVPNALYWLGETYYNDKRYAQSILTFKEVTRRFPKHNKAAASMLKIGFAYDKLGDATNARFYLETLLEDYPDSDPAAMAKQKLAQIP